MPGDVADFDAGLFTPYRKVVPDVSFFPGSCRRSLLTACATPQAPVNLGAGAFANPGSSYGVLMTALPPSDTFFPGADCLLCIAAASVANNKPTAHVKTLTPADLAKLSQEAATALRKKGATVTVSTHSTSRPCRTQRRRHRTSHAKISAA
jgi:hypothetical protein